MMAARVCPTCSVPWPTTISSAFCPTCSRQLCLEPGKEPLHDEDAARLIAQVRFERYWKKWNPENADPDIRAEALKEVQARVAMWREFEDRYEEAT